MGDLRRAGVVTSGADVKNIWREGASKILEVITHRQAGQADYQRVGPASSHADISQLRAKIVDASPQLHEFTEAIREQLKGACAVYIPSLGLEGFDHNQRALLAYSISVCLGNPTATDQKQVIWDIKSRKRDSTYFSTFSETDAEAAFHTDTQYYPDPEPTILLYCMAAARCGGGISSVCDARALREDIDATEPWISEVLSDRRLPFRVPTAFLTSAEPDAVQATLAPVFATSPLIRYRRDTLAQGLLHFPELGDADAHRALDAFERHLADSEHQAEFFMPTDSLVVVDNHRALHARTSFQDHERHLLRIRLHRDEIARSGGQYRLVTRRSRATSVTS